MTTVHTGIKVPWGVCDVQPIYNAPYGKKRILMRNNLPVRVYIRTPDGIRCFIPEVTPGGWRINNSLEQKEGTQGYDSI